MDKKTKGIDIEQGKFTLHYDISHHLEHKYPISLTTKYVDVSFYCIRNALEKCLA